MATFELIAVILLLVSALGAGLLMLRRDALMLQQAELHPVRFYGLVTEREEYLTVHRIVLLVVLIASVTTMAMSSPYVVALLALFLVGLDVAALRAKPADDVPAALSAPARRVMWVTAVLLVLVAGLTVITSGLYGGAVAALAFATFSYAPSLAVGWLMQLPSKKNQQQ